MVKKTMNVIKKTSTKAKVLVIASSILGLVASSGSDATAWSGLCNGVVSMVMSDK